MFREMRLRKQQLSAEDCISILHKATSGVLAVSGDDGYPYAVPLSFVYRNSKIYFHGAKTGHRVDAVQNNEKASFCIIDKDLVMPEEFTTYYRSLIVFGRICILEKEEEKTEALELLSEKYAPGDEAGMKKYMEKEFKGVCVLELTVEHMTGKIASELLA
ncbi:MAG: pyridoxamine 5'-phosphate oxidase family protein [Lachnospiraceae bacterium]|nr:pyridoxamine 5'-phosphate oxidase family protein [Lachnospiraceae bacterium]